MFQDKTPKERKASKIVVSEGVINVALNMEDEKVPRLSNGLIGGPICAANGAPPSAPSMLATRR